MHIKKLKIQRLNLCTKYKVVGRVSFAITSQIGVGYKFPKTAAVRSSVTYIF